MPEVNTNMLAAVPIVIPAIPANPAQPANSAVIPIDYEAIVDHAETAGTAGTAGSVENLCVGENIPGILRKLVSLGKRQEEKELLLLAGITALSVCFPTVSGIYGDKRYYPNVYLMAVGPAASGKGKMNLCRSILLPLHRKLIEESKGSEERRQLLIPANCSATAFQEILSKNPNGCIIFETEGDTLTDTFNQDYGDYSSCFRCAFEHEMISYARRENKELVEIYNPKLSVLLSGTPGQVIRLIKDPENGLFSRFAFYRLQGVDYFHVENNSEETQSNEEKCVAIGEELLKILEDVLSFGQVNFKMTEEQWEMFNKEFRGLENEYYALYDKDQIRASIRRLGVIRFRISMILMVLKALENKALDSEIYCDEECFELAGRISTMLAEHMTYVYRLLPNIPLQKGQFKTKMEKQLYDCLPKQFKTADFFQNAKAIGFNERSVERYLPAWKKDGIVTSISKGIYEKTER